MDHFVCLNFKYNQGKIKMFGNRGQNDAVCNANMITGEIKNIGTL